MKIYAIKQKVSFLILLQYFSLHPVKLWTMIKSVKRQIANSAIYRIEFLSWVFEGGIALFSMSRAHSQLCNSLKSLQLRIRYILQGTLFVTVLLPPLFLHKLNTNSLNFTVKSHWKDFMPVQRLLTAPYWRLQYTIYYALTERSSENSWISSMQD